MSSDVHSCGSGRRVTGAPSVSRRRSTRRAWRLQPPAHSPSGSSARCPSRWAGADCATGARGATRPADRWRRTLPGMASTIRRDAGLYGYERALARRGLWPVAGADEAGRGACAGPLVVGAVILPEGKRGQVPGLADSKLLPPAARERVYAQVVRRALAWSAVVIPAQEVDRLGLHVCNIMGMRRALAQLAVSPAYVLTDGFPVP